MKTKYRIIMVLGIITIAMITAGVSLGKQFETDAPADKSDACYTEQELTLLMEEGHYQREQAIEMLELACEHAVVVEEN